MFKVILKKQLYEVFKGYFYDSKKNKSRKKAAVVGLFVLFAVLMIGVLGGMVGAFSYGACMALEGKDMGWFYFMIFGVLSIMLGVFGSVFNTYASLYCAKDNDLLFSMPIPAHVILAARLMNVYLMGLLYSGVIIIPAILVRLVVEKGGLMQILGGIVLLIEIAAICFILSCILGWVVAQISLRIKHKNIVTVFAALIFLGLYYFVYFKAVDYVGEFLIRAVLFGASIKKHLYPLYVWGRTGEGDPYAMAVGLLITLAVLLLTCFIMYKTFYKVATSTGAMEKKVYKEKKITLHSADSALLRKEFARFTGSAAYMLNCGIGILFLPVMGAVFLVKGPLVLRMIKEMAGPAFAALSVILQAVVMVMGAMNDMAAPSVSLEGKNIWLAQSLPVTPWQALRAKLKMQLILAEIPVLIALLCMLKIMPGTPAELGLGILTVVVVVYLQALWDLFCGISLPNLKWTNEIGPIKQSLAVVLAMLGSAGYGFLYGGLYVFVMLKGWKIQVLQYEGIALIVSLILCLVLRTVLKTRGTKKFASL